MLTTSTVISTSARHITTTRITMLLASFTTNHGLARRVLSKVSVVPCGISYSGMMLIILGLVWHCMSLSVFFLKWSCYVILAGV